MIDDENEKVYITLQLWEKSGWEYNDTWNPISKIQYDKKENKFNIVLKDGSVKHLKW